jgi:hypothetical protein
MRPVKVLVKETGLVPVPGPDPAPGEPGAATSVADAEGEAVLMGAGASIVVGSTGTELLSEAAAVELELDEVEMTALGALTVAVITTFADVVWLVKKALVLVDASEVVEEMEADFVIEG